MIIPDRIIIKAALRTYRAHLVGLESNEPSTLAILQRVKEMQKEKPYI